MSWSNEVVLALAILSLIFWVFVYMVVHLWLWRRRCAPREEIEIRTMPRSLPFGGRLVPKQYIRYSPSDPTTPYVPFGPRETRLVHVIGGLKMKMPAKGDPVMTIPGAAFNRLMLSPSWLTPDKYPDQVELVEGEIGCMLSHEGAVRVRVQKENAGDPPPIPGKSRLRTLNDRVAELVTAYMDRDGGLTQPQFRVRYETLIWEWRDKGCPDYY